jgi:hypothetical protein
MITLVDAVRGYLIDNGLFPDQADQVMARFNAKLTEEDPEWPRRSREHADAYPPAMRTILCLRARPMAIAWIDETMPKHWARPMFADETPRAAS